MGTAVLLCSLSEITDGMVVGASVLHPNRPETELLAAGVILDQQIVKRLRQIGVTEVWVHHDDMSDLDSLVNPQLTEARRAVYSRIKKDFSNMATRTVSTAQVQDYRQTIMHLVCELISSRNVAGLADQLFSAQGELFSHCANVAYLAILTGLELQPYVIRQRIKLPLEHARDLTSLGLGAMLHDIGKTALGKQAASHHEVHPLDQADKEIADEYATHVFAGYSLMRGSRTPASAMQVILNHHQRFDGEGWPDMSAITKNRQKGTQKGSQIHIFNRIVAVANVVDSLMRDAEGNRRPPVAALCELASERFDGWFDPTVRQMMLRRLPPFPLGSQVRLSDGRLAAVISPNLKEPCRPIVRLLTGLERDSAGRRPTLQLSARPDLRIVECAGIDVTHWLYEIPTRIIEQASAAVA